MPWRWPKGIWGQAPKPCRCRCMCTSHFASRVCYYCACNKIITKHHDRADVYLRYLSREIDLHTAQCGVGQVVSQLHLGGGTPTFLSDDGLRELMSMLKRSFTLAPGGNIPSKWIPALVNAERLALLAELGFNRLSFGVQDFDSEVQKAVHRVQPAEQVFALVESARTIGFDSINVDLIYGLPRQTPESFDRTLSQVAQLRPDRIALYAYAHLPERFKPQRRIISAELPTAGAPDSPCGSRSLDAFIDAGYVCIGMDHFALLPMRWPLLQTAGAPAPQFQGYSTQPIAI